MEDYRLGEMEQRFAQLIWAHEPIGSGELVKLCGKELGWKKSTTYTVLRRLCEKGLFQNENGAVTSLLSSAAGMMASAAFLPPLTTTVPSSLRPPWILSFSAISAMPDELCCAPAHLPNSC